MTLKNTTERIQQRKRLYIKMADIQLDILRCQRNNHQITSGSYQHDNTLTMTKFSGYVTNLANRDAQMSP
jgi:hypothetical protein